MRAFARGAAEAVGGVVEEAEEEEDVVVERLGVRKSLLESDEDEAEARARAMVNMARLSASGGGEVMRRIPEDVLPLLFAFRRARGRRPGGADVGAGGFDGVEGGAGARIVTGCGDSVAGGRHVSRGARGGAGGFGYGEVPRRFPPCSTR